MPRHPSAPVLATVDPYVDTCATDGCRGCPNWERRTTIGSMDWLILLKKYASKPGFYLQTQAVPADIFPKNTILGMEDGVSV